MILARLTNIVAEGYMGIEVFDEYMDRYADSEEEAMQEARKLEAIFDKYGQCIVE